MYRIVLATGPLSGIFLDRRNIQGKRSILYMLRIYNTTLDVLVISLKTNIWVIVFRKSCVLHLLSVSDNIWKYIVNSLDYLNWLSIHLTPHRRGFLPAIFLEKLEFTPHIYWLHSNSLCNQPYFLYVVVPSPFSETPQFQQLWEHCDHRVTW